MAIKLTGYKEIDQVLRGLPLQVTDKILAASFADAAKPLIESIKSFTPIGKTSTLINSIGYEKEKFFPETVGTIQVGPKRKGKYKGLIAPIINDGTVVRKTKSGANRGKVTAVHFMEKGVNAEGGNKTIGRIADSIGKKLSSFMKRTIKNS